MSDSETKPAYITWWVSTQMAEILEKRKRKHQVGTRQIEKKKNIFSKDTKIVDEPIYETRDEWVGTGKYSDIRIDIEDFSDRVADACNELDRRGYDVISVIPVIGGRYNYQSKYNYNPTTVAGYGYGYGYGYSVTDGVTIIGKLRC